MTYSCPLCGVAEGAYHERGCAARPAGVRPCCRSFVFLDSFMAHEETCPSWGPRPIAEWQYPDLSRDPWWDVRWSA